MTVWWKDQFARISRMPGDDQALTGIRHENDETAPPIIHPPTSASVFPTEAGEEGKYECGPLTSRMPARLSEPKVQCAHKCHAHPFFNSLKQESFWGIQTPSSRQVRSEGPRGMRRQDGADSDPSP